MNDQQIQVLMAKTPDIRAVQISDALDKPLTDVSQALRSLVEVGDVVASKGFSPNGHPAQLYNLSDEFKKSKEYKSVMAIVAAQQPPAAAPSPVAARPAPAPVATPVFIPADQPTSSRAERGIAYITKHLRATQDDLRKAMGLSKAQYPAAFLSAAIRSGKLHKDGDIWKLGAAPLDSVVEVGNIAVASTDSSPIPAAVVHAIAAAPVFRCGLWSDGMLELQRNGSTVAVLEQQEGEQLVGFVNRMLIDPLGTTVQTSAPKQG